MDRFQNVKYVVSPPSKHSYQQRSSIIISQKGIQPNRLFSSGVRQQSRSFGEISVARSDFYNASSLHQNTNRGIGKGLGNYAEQRFRKIAKEFISFYGNGTQIQNHGIRRIQKEAYEKCMQKPQFGDQSQKQLLKIMDQNRDGRVTEEDIVSLCRRYLNCEKRYNTYTPLVQERLAVARRLFQQFDVEKKGYLTEKQVPNLLAQTYKSLGKSFNATEEDVTAWMKIADGDGDGQVNLQEYERSIIRALNKQEIKIYEE